MRDITSWLGDSRLPLRRITPNHWEVTLRHLYCEYTVVIINHDNWFSFAADLFSDALGAHKEGFYRKALDLNGRINGVHIGLDGGRLILIRDDFAEDITKYNLFRSLNLFHQAHEYVYRELLREADMLGVQLKSH